MPAPRPGRDPAPPSKALTRTPAVLMIVFGQYRSKKKSGKCLSSRSHPARLLLPPPDPNRTCTMSSLNKTKSESSALFNKFPESSISMLTPTWSAWRSARCSDSRVRHSCVPMWPWAYATWCRNYTKPAGKYHTVIFWDGVGTAWCRKYTHRPRPPSWRD